MKNKLLVFLFILSVMGLVDSIYLSHEHFAKVIPPCTADVFLFVDCGKVLRSPYSMMFGLPLALYGVVHYLMMTTWIAMVGSTKKSIYSRLLLLQSITGFIFSGYLVFLQFIVIKSICIYCMASAIVSTIIFSAVQIGLAHERKKITIEIMGFVYKNLLKKVLFRIDPEKVHVAVVRFGEVFGSMEVSRGTIVNCIRKDLPILSQTIDQLKFGFPIGLAAGFDYEGRLTKSLSPWGFGFQTVGTITNKAYGGNSPPMLGRLPKSKSLLVNKGFKNPGAAEIVKKLAPISFDIPVGISIGRTNSKDLKTQKQSVDDVVTTFLKFENSIVKHAYYELNISCPNLLSSVEFYSSKNLTELLVAIDLLKLSRPIFVKMPIEKTEKDTLRMLEIIAKYNIRGVIFGNLQKNKSNPLLDPDEVAKFTRGYYSGKPTYEDSNKMIRLAYKYFKDRFVIIGCGGVFSAADAFEKIRSGATLVQLITGMIYQGPQLIMEINFELSELIKQAGYTNISEAIGSYEPSDMQPN